MAPAAGQSTRAAPDNQHGGPPDQRAGTGPRTISAGPRTVARPRGAPRCASHSDRPPGQSAPAPGQSEHGPAEAAISAARRQPQRRASAARHSARPTPRRRPACSPGRRRATWRNGSASRSPCCWPAAVTAAGDLGLASLRDGGADIIITAVDDDQPVTRAALATQPELAAARSATCAPSRSPSGPIDIVALPSCCWTGSSHAELVLDRLTGAVKPGGLLLLQIRDRDARRVPGPGAARLAARAPVWRRLRPGRPGPYPAVYELLASVRGVQSYVLLRGLVIAERQAARRARPAALPARPRAATEAAQQAGGPVVRGGRLTAAHEDFLYVLRKPESATPVLVARPHGLPDRVASGLPAAPIGRCDWLGG